MVDTDDSQTVINVKGGSRKERDRAERRGSSSQLQLLRSMQSIGQLGKLLQAGRSHHQPMTGQFPQAAPPSTEPVLVPPSLFSLVEHSHG